MSTSRDVSRLSPRRDDGFSSGNGLRVFDAICNDSSVLGQLRFNEKSLRWRLLARPIHELDILIDPTHETTLMDVAARRIIKAIECIGRY